MRSETERTAAASEGVRAYYLATGAIDRAIFYMMLGPGQVNPDGTPRYYKPGQPRFEFDFPTGHASVELIPESAKLNINMAPPPDLARLFLATGLPPEAATEMAAAVVDWRSAAPPSAVSPFDQFYLGQPPGFKARHAMFEEIEELLFVKGMTPELFHGSYQRTPEGRLIPTGGLKDCLSVWGASAGFDINSAHPILLNSLGIPADVVAAIVDRRARQPFLRPEELLPIQQSAGPAAGKLRIGGNATYTIRATATIGIPAQGGLPPRLSDIRRSVAAVVRFNYEAGSLEPYTVLRWYDNAGNR